MGQYGLSIVVLKSFGSRFTGSAPCGRSCGFPDPASPCRWSAPAFSLLSVLQPAAKSRTSAATMAIAQKRFLTWTFSLDRRSLLLILSSVRRVLDGGVCRRNLRGG